jgi:hypothetical protein
LVEPGWPQKLLLLLLLAQELVVHLAQHWLLHLQRPSPCARA